MRLSVITPCFNSARFIEKTVKSVLAQRDTPGLEIEYIVVDGKSTDDTLEVLAPYRDSIARLISEPDSGPASALNKGFRLATGELLAWINADDVYEPDAFAKCLETMRRRPGRALYFGRCNIVDLEGHEIRRGITRFKNAFFPFSCRPLIQSINYVSQPAMFFTRAAYEKAGPLREDLKAAFDYELILRLWRQGGAATIPSPAISDFLWYPGTISGQTFRRQFQEEFEAAVADAGRFSPQALAHWFVKNGIIWAYGAMERKRLLSEQRNGHNGNRTGV